MAVTEKEYQSIISYVKEKLLDAINADHISYTVSSIEKQIKYEEWLSQYTPKRTKRQPAVGEYAAEWEEFWNQWPRIRTVKELGQRGICNKDFRGPEGKIKDKYLKIVISGKISAEELNYAAKSYIANAIADSIKMGRNELEFRSGCIPWLNQEKYLTWKDIEMPATVKDTSIYTEA